MAFSRALLDHEGKDDCVRQNVRDREPLYFLPEANGQPMKLWMVGSPLGSREETTAPPKPNEIRCVVPGQRIEESD